MNEESAPAPETSESRVGYLLRRVVAGLIDLVVIALIGLVMTIAFGDTSEDEGFEVSLSGLPLLAYIFLIFGYYFVMESATGQTIGKMVMGLMVVSTRGVRPTADRIAIRTVLRLVDGFAFYTIGLITVAVTGKARIGDLAAGTIVVKA